MKNIVKTFSFICSLCWQTHLSSLFDGISLQPKVVYNAESVHLWVSIFCSNLLYYSHILLFFALVLVFRPLLWFLDYFYCQFLNILLKTSAWVFWSLHWNFFTSIWWYPWPFIIFYSRNVNFQQEISWPIKDVYFDLSSILFYYVKVSILIILRNQGRLLIV